MLWSTLLPSFTSRCCSRFEGRRRVEHLVTRVHYNTNQSRTLFLLIIIKPVVDGYLPVRERGASATPLPREKQPRYVHVRL